MKLTHGLTAALAGLASAAGTQQSAQVYLVPSSESASSQPPASVSASLARLIFLQRLSPLGEGPSVLDVTDGTKLDDVVDAMNRFGKAPPSRSTQTAQLEPKQLVVLLEEMTTAQMTELRKQVKSAYKGMKPAFEIPNPPPTQAHEDLVEIDFHNAGLKAHAQCDVDMVTDPENEKCWGRDAKATFARYNIKKESKVMEKLHDALNAISKLPAGRSVELMIVALPAIESSAVKSWRPEELRRRQAEEVMSITDNDEEPATTSKPKEHDFFISTKAKKPIPACFSSKDSCITGTGNCSGHGQCHNRYAKPDGSEGKEACYTCHCLSTVSESGSLTHWAGGACTKKDISTPFWLFAGFTIMLLGILTLGIGMLFSVGEETLPGVIGAGVSRPSK